MRAWPILLIVGSSLIGCATVTPNPWESVSVDDTPATRCDRIPDRPIPDFDSENNTFVYDQQGIEALDRYFTLSEICAEIADLHAKQIDELKKAAHDLVEAGKAQRRVADLRQEIIIEERRQHWMEKAGLYAIILAGLGVASF